MKFFKHRYKAEERLAEESNSLNAKITDSLTRDFQGNINRLKELFKDNEIIKSRIFISVNNPGFRFCIFYCDGLVDEKIIDEHIIKPVMLLETPPPETIGALKGTVIEIGDAREVLEIKDIIIALTYGDTLLIAENCSGGLLLNTKKIEGRTTIEPDSEKVLSGPREGFTEVMMKNISLVQKRLRTNDLKMKFKSFGRRTNTQICVAYLDSLINRDVLRELYKRLDELEVDSILDEHYISERIRDNPMSPFRATGLTERPDVVAAKLLEGRIALFVDGSPCVMTVPYLLIENFQSNEDYYLSFYYTSFSRMLRIVGFFLTVFVPGFYIAAVAFHQEILPAQMMISIATERQSVPLPAAVEAVILLIMFDILRETGVRMPSNVGQALSIVGALVVGEAAVQAKLVSASMIIVVAVTGITGLLIPKMNAPIIFARMCILISASFLGFFGLSLGMAVLLIHMLNLRSFGVLQMIPDRKFKFQEIKDTFFRAPWWLMLHRPKELSGNIIRSKNNREKG